MLILWILVGLCVLSLPAALVVGAALYRNDGGQLAVAQQKPVRHGHRPARPAA
jgi:hypothetical protein